MMLSELEHLLPNGLHDAELVRFSMDYAARTLELDLNVWTGDMASPQRREGYRPACVRIQEVAYVVVEPPDTRYPWSEPGPREINVGVGMPPQSDSRLPDAPQGTERTWVYIKEHNRFLHFAGGEATMEWTGPEVVRG